MFMFCLMVKLWSVDELETPNAGTKRRMREADKGDTPSTLPWDEEKGPSSTTQILASRATLGKLLRDGLNVCGLFQAHRYHLELLGERGPASIRQTLEHFQRQCWGNFWETRCNTYVLFWTHRYHLELNFVGQVKANSITRQVTASYTTEELKAEIQITLPESYPLGGITVDAQRHAVVKQAQWERILLQLNVFLQHQVCVGSVCVFVRYVCVQLCMSICMCMCILVPTLGLNTVS